MEPHPQPTGAHDPNPQPKTGRARTFAREFKAFAFKGNVIDLAVGIVIGTAFNAIVTSLVNNVIMQAIAHFFGRPDFSSIVVADIHIGSFVTQVVNFLIIALTLFVILRYLLREDFIGEKTRE